MGHNFWSLDLILHFCGQMPFGTIIQNNFTISHPFGMNPLHSCRCISSSAMNHFDQRRKLFSSNDAA